MSAHAAEPIDGMYRHYRPEIITIKGITTMSKSLNIKNMKETIVNFSGDEETFDEIWETFYQMCCLGFISRDTWRKFADQCRGWHVDEENACVYDMQNCSCDTGAIVWKYTPDAEYKA